MPYQLWDRDGHSARLAICFAEVVGVQLDDDSSESDSNSASDSGIESD